MIAYDSVTIQSPDTKSNVLNDIYQSLKMLYTTPEGTVPFDRKYGINMDLLDEPITIIQGKLTIEYIEKTKMYEPRATVEEVLFEGDFMNGKLMPRVVIRIDPEAI